MRNTMDKTKLALLSGALLAIALAGCNRERDQMDTEPSASTAAAAATAEPGYTDADTMAGASTMAMPPSAVTSAADVTAEVPPTDGLDEPPTASTAAQPMDNTETEQTPTDASGNPTR